LNNVFKFSVMARSRSVFATVDPVDGRAEVGDLISFVARRVDGVWERGKGFPASDLKDNFRPVLDEAEANALLNEAKAALSNSSTCKNISRDVQTLYQNALRFAAEKHKEQKIPGTDLPYVVHQSNVVMEIFIAAMNTEGFNLPLAAQVALLHDTVEDTDAPYDELLNQFGQDVADGVLALTKEHTLPKESQMPDSLERIKKQPKEVWAVKLADRITNLQPPPAHWSGEKRIRYQNEAKTIYRELKDGNQYLADRLLHKIYEYGVFALCNSDK